MLIYVHILHISDFIHRHNTKKNNKKLINVIGCSCLRQIFFWTINKFDIKRNWNKQKLNIKNIKKKKGEN